MSDQTRGGEGQRARRKAGGGRMITTGILLLPVVAVLLPTCVVLAVGMVPSMVAYVVDRSGGRYLTITVALMNFCGTLPGLAELWRQGQAYAAAARIAADPIHWLASYGAAAGGWIVYLAIPPILAAFYSSLTNTRVERLKREQAALVEVWGPEVKTDDASRSAEDE